MATSFRSKSRRLAVGGLALLLAAAALLVGMAQWLARPVPTASEGPEALALALDAALKRGRNAAPGVALRPLAPASASPELASLAEDVCSALAERLARLPSLRVVPCRSTAAAVAAQLDDPALARLLAVRHVLNGTVEPLADDRVRVRLALLELPQRREAWRLDEEMGRGDLQALPARVIRATSSTLGVAADVADEPLIRPDLHAQYLRARTLARRPSLDDRRQAVRLLDDVLAAEPEHVPALFLRQNLRGQLLGNLDEGRSLAELNAARAANVEQGLALARRIVAADPLDLRGQWLLLAHEIEVRQWVAGFDRLDEMIRRSGRHAGLLRLAARLHLHAGYVGRARELALAAAQVDALDAEAIEILALTAGIEGRDAELREFISIAKQIGHQGMGRAEVFEAWRRQDWAAVEHAHAAWVGWGGKWSAHWVPAWTRGLADPAWREAAAQMLDSHDAATRQHFVSYFVEYALLGDTARSLAAVQHHAKLPPATWMQHLWWPELAAVRQSAGFVEAMQALGITALWDARGAPDLCAKSASGGWHCR
jgi:TolB-like protein